MAVTKAKADSSTVQLMQKGNKRAKMPFLHLN